MTLGTCLSLGGAHYCRRTRGHKQKADVVPLSSSCSSKKEWKGAITCVVRRWKALAAKLQETGGLWLENAVPLTNPQFRLIKRIDGLIVPAFHSPMTRPCTGSSDVNLITSFSSSSFFFKDKSDVDCQDKLFQMSWGLLLTSFWRTNAFCSQVLSSVPIHHEI